MKVLVTGASGFVGRALVDELRHGERAYEVHALGRADGDLSEEGVAAAAVAESRPDVVVHSAARIGVARCEEEPLLALRSNVLATAFVARAATTQGARLAYVSSADVYGMRPEVVDEEAAAAPESRYALTKWWGEEVARLYAPEGLLVLRLANPYGPGVEPGGGKGALPTMLLQAERRDPIRAFRDEARAWCWIGDVVRGIRLALDVEGLLNVGSDAEPVPLVETARLACDLAGAPHELVKDVEAPPGRVAPRVSVERLRALGWQPEVELEEGLRRSLESMRAAAPA